MAALDDPPLVQDNHAQPRVGMFKRGRGPVRTA